MQGPQKRTIGEEIYNEILDNVYLQEIYNGLAYNYSIKLFNINRPLKQININHALRFADILSKAANVKNAQFLVALGQSMALMINALYSNENSSYCLGEILSNLSNFRGIKSQNLKSFKSLDVLDNFFYEFEKSNLTIPGQNDEYFFYEQKKVFDGLQNKYFSYSGPTSMGKSFLVRTFIIDEINKDIKKNYAVVVPTRALINEVRHSFIEALKEKLQEKNYRIVSGSGDIVLKYMHSFIFVVTQERLMNILTSIPDLKIDLLFIDEAHKITEKSERSVYYYRIIDKVVKNNNDCKIIFASPNIPNPEVYLKTITNINKNDIHKLACQYSPVSQFKFLIDLLENKICYYDEINKKLVDINVNANVSNLYEIIDLVGKDKQNVIYCSSKAKAIDYALGYSEKLHILQSDELKKLSEDIKKYVHRDCYLCDLILKGIAYHVGYLPTHIKKRIEDYFERGIIRTIFCTSTLVEGVNLPADNLIVLKYRNGKSNLNEVSFRNLLGRVGRIKYNLYGNVILLRLDNGTKIDKYTEFIIRDAKRRIARAMNLDEHIANQTMKILFAPVDKLSPANSQTDIDFENLNKLIDDMSLREYNAFLVNNKERIIADIQGIDEREYGKMEETKIKECDWSIPKSQYYKYHKKIEATKKLNKNVFTDYSDNILHKPNRSVTEIEFENWCEENQNIKWVYKNGDKGEEFFSIVYRKGFRRANFYPDYIIGLNDGSIWIIEAKGGQDEKGESNNIDIYAGRKFNALKEYCNQNDDVKFGFVRAVDKSIFISNTEWDENVLNNSVWKNINEIL